jgi:nucleotide-binding universal stress UspA family protein
MDERSLKMLSHILVPLDGSQLAEQALEEAREILSEGGRLVLVTGIELPENWFFGMQPLAVYPDNAARIPDVQGQARSYLERVANPLRASACEVETVVEVGDAATVILRTAARRQVDAIVMSTHGRSGISRWLLGSVTAKVLSAAPCPVFVIPDKERRHELKHDVMNA